MSTQSNVGMNNSGINKERMMNTNSVEQTGTQEQSAVVAVYDTHSEAEAAVRDLQQLGFDMTKLSIIGKDYLEILPGYRAKTERKQR